MLLWLSALQSGLMRGLRAAALPLRYNIGEVALLAHGVALQSSRYVLVSACDIDYSSCFMRYHVESEWVTRAGTFVTSLCREEVCICCACLVHLGGNDRCISAGIHIDVQAADPGEPCIYIYMCAPPHGRGEAKFVHYGAWSSVMSGICVQTCTWS